MLRPCRLLGLLAVIALTLLLGKAAFSRITHRNAKAQPIAQLAKQFQEEPCTDKLCTAEHHKHHTFAVSRLIFYVLLQSALCRLVLAKTSGITLLFFRTLLQGPRTASLSLCSELVLLLVYTQWWVREAVK